jgi:hypothetical protein
MRQPVNEFDFSLQQQPFFNHTRIMNVGVVLLEMVYTIGIKQL